jgi:hypothetical protein
VPSMIVQPGSSRIEIPANALVPAGVLDLSSTVPVDTWMADPDTNLLRAHRWKSVRNVLIAVAAILVVVALVIVVVHFTGDKNDAEATTPPVTADAVVAHVPADAPGPDAGISKDDILALSKFGFFSITATAKTTIWIDGTQRGDTPLTRYPLLPGPHKLKAIGPRGKPPKNMNIVIYGGRDTEAEPIVW